MKYSFLLCFTALLLTSCGFHITEKMVLYDLNPKYRVKEYLATVQKDTTLTDSQIYAINNQIDIITKGTQTEIFSDATLKINRNFFNPNDTITLEYFVFTPIKTDKTIYYFIGNLESIFDVIDNLKLLSRETNSKIFLLNYRGYGSSSGSISFKTQFDDNQKFYQFTKNEIVGNKISIGYSLGSVYATYFGADNKFDEIVLLSPFSNTKEEFSCVKRNSTKGLKCVMRPFISLTADDYLMTLSNSKKLSSYTNKLLIMHAKDDETLDYSMGKSLYKKSNSKDKELITLETGGHGAAFKPVNWNTLIQKLK